MRHASVPMTPTFERPCYPFRYLFSLDTHKDILQIYADNCWASMLLLTAVLIIWYMPHEAVSFNSLLPSKLGDAISTFLQRLRSGYARKLLDQPGNLSSSDC
ncbi:hypothetical protein OPQ81_008531 [Rhizoctonia solani]|nr:hypothetical protein OPQ81_008531 [Rhizoctonia solani]